MGRETKEGQYILPGFEEFDSSTETGLGRKTEKEFREALASIRDTYPPMDGDGLSATAADI